MIIKILNTANGRTTEYTEQDIEEEVRSLRKQNGVQQRCTVTLRIYHDGKGSPGLYIRDMHGNSGATSI
jgi:hypothetical protein